MRACGAAFAGLATSTPRYSGTTVSPLSVTVTSFSVASVTFRGVSGVGLASGSLMLAPNPEAVAVSVPTPFSTVSTGSWALQ